MAEIVQMNYDYRLELPDGCSDTGNRKKDTANQDATPPRATI